MSVARQVRSDNSPQSIVRLEVGPNEKILWAGRPGRGALVRTQAAKIFPGIFFLVFAVLWLYTTGGKAWLAGEPGTFSVFSLFGLIAAVPGLGLTLSPLWMWLAARWTTYAILERRLVIISSFPVHRVYSYGPRDIQELERTERGDKSGDIVFRRELSASSRNRRQAKRIGFFGIPNVRRVEDLVRALKPDKL
jgi:hypothetical protein